MASPVQFSVDDTSPAVSYSPFGDTFGIPSLRTGWNPYFLDSGFATAQGQVGVGQSQHITSRDGASVTLEWNGTAIQLFGNTTASASFNLTLDGVPTQPNQTDTTTHLLTSFVGLPNTRHSISLTAKVPDASSLVVFDKAVITSPPPVDFSQLIFTEHSINDDDIDFTGQWTFLPSTGQPAFHQSQTQTDTATLTFSGISVRIFGTTSPASGNYSVVLDNQQSPIFSARSSFANTNTLLYFASGLAANTTHQITLRNEGGLLQLPIGTFTIFSSGDPTTIPPSGNSPPPNSTTPIPPSQTPAPAQSNGFTRGTIAALVLAGFLTFFIFTTLLFYFCIWRPRRQRRRRQRRDYENDRDLNFAYAPGATPSRPRKFIFRPHRDSSDPQEKDQEPHSAAVIQEIPAVGPGAILDIGHEQSTEDVPGDNQPDDTFNIIPDVAGALASGSSPRSGGVRSSGGDDPDRGGHRDSAKSGGGFSGFARWKRDINTLSGLTALGLNFRHSDEKSPVSDYGGGADDGGNGSRGFIYGTYDPEVDGGIGGQSASGAARAERIRSTSTQSSNRSFGRRFVRRRSGNHHSDPSPGNGNGKGKGRLSTRIGSAGFPFRLSTGSRRGETSHQGDRPHDEESLSGFTSLSYASNPNVTGYLDIQPPSYAASVSASGGSNASSPPSVPRSVTRSPQSQTRELGADIHGPSPLSEEVPPPPPVPPLTSTESRPTGMHILGIGGGLSSVGGPISMRAALRGLSPRISKSRSMERRRSKSAGKEGVESQEVGKERRRELPLPPSQQAGPSGSSQGHLEQQQRDESATTSIPLPPVVIPASSTAGTRTGSPIRALPPIPVPPPATSTPQHPQLRVPEHEPHPQSLPQPQHPPPSVTSPPSSYLNVPQPSPLRLSFDQSRSATGTSTPVAPSSSSSSSNQERRFKPRSSSGDAAGLGSPGAVHSFAEAAALAGALSATSGIVEEEEEEEFVDAVEGEGEGEGEVAGPSSEETAKRLSTASRVRFENVPSSSSASPTSLDDGERAWESKEMKSRFRLTPLSGQSPPGGIVRLPETSDTSPGSVDSNLPRPETTGQGQPSGFVGTASFLDFSSQPSSLHDSRRASETTSGLERSTSDSSRHWSMQLPGRSLPAPPSVSGTSGALRSKWSNTTAHTTRTRSESSSSGSGYGSPPAQPPPTLAVSDHSSNRNIFPFPLSIPPSPHMPEGFTGVEPSPSLMSPTTSIPPVFSPPSSSRRGDSSHQRLLHVPDVVIGGTTGATTAGSSRQRSTGDNNDPEGQHHEISHSGNNNETAVDSPTDSFPYSISEVHFRTSVGTESDLDMETGRIQYARQHLVAHPPLPSTPLTPQRFAPQQEESQQQQGGSSSSIVHRVFGGGNTGGGTGSGSATPRTPRSG